MVRYGWVSLEGEIYWLAPSGALTAHAVIMTMGNHDQTGNCSALPVFEIIPSSIDYYVAGTVN